MRTLARAYNTGAAKVTKMSSEGRHPGLGQLADSVPERWVSHTSMNG
jgi:hypothetical protein